MKQIVVVPKKNVAQLVVGVIVLLLIPLSLTLLNQNATLYGGPGGGWDWGPLDFVIMGALLFVTGLAIQFAIQNITDPTRKTVAISTILLALVAIWVELAVDAVSRLVQFLSAFTAF